MNMENKNYNIAKLDGSNYFLWKVKLEMVLLKEKLWNVINEQPPTTNIEEWTIRDQSARATICLALDDKILITVVDCRTARETWMRLKEVYEHANLTSKLYLMKKLFGIRYDEYSNMEDYLNHIRELTERLRAIGETVKPSYVIAVIIGGLPESYYPLVTALEARDESDLSVEYVSEKLRDEAKRKESQVQSNKDTMLALASNHFRVDNVKRNRIVCHRCGNEGHIKRNCRLTDSEVSNSNTMKQKRDFYNNYNGERGAYYTNSPIKTEEERGWNEREPYRDMTHEEWALSGTPMQLDNTDTMWVIDSGASSHMVPDARYITGKVELTPPLIIQMANGDTMEAVGKGDLTLNFEGENNVSQQIKLINVLIIPNLKQKLLSVIMLCENGYTVEFERSKCVIKLNSEVIAVGNKKGNIFVVHGSYNDLNNCFTCVHGWHSRLGHRNIPGIKNLAKEKIVKNLNIAKCKHTDFCSTCKIGAMNQISFKTSCSTSPRAFHTLVSDICGPISPATFGGKHYLLTITDNFSNFTHVDVIDRKSETALCIINFLKAGYNKFNYWPEVFRSDGGGEYCGNMLEEFLKSQGIVHQTTIPNTPMQNGKSERKNRTLFNMIRCMLKGKKLPLGLWGEAARTAVHILNRVQHSGMSVTPHELWTGHRPNIGYFKEFGCIAYAFVDRHKRDKLGDTAVKGVFIGYGIGKKGYRIWIPKTRKILNVATASFDEEKTPSTEMEIHETVPPAKTDDFDFYTNGQSDDNDYAPKVKSPELRRSLRSTKGVPAKKLSF